MKAELKTCECGVPTYSDRCGLCYADDGLFQTPAKVKSIPVPEDAVLWSDGVWQDSSGNVLGPAA